MFSCNAYILRFKIKEKNCLHYQTSLGFFFLVLKFFLWHNKGMPRKKNIYIYMGKTRFLSSLKSGDTDFLLYQVDAPKPT